MIRKTLTAVEAKEQAQMLSFAPFAFQTALTMRNTGLLAALDNAGDKGITVDLLADQTDISEYGVQVLADMAVSAGIISVEDDHYQLTKVGYFLLHDKMTRVNMDFTAEICYRPLDHLTESIVEGKAAGLKELGDWPTVYRGLPYLSKPQSDAWFAFDHYYSDQAFPTLLNKVFSQPTKTLVDIGGNTGRWASQCCNHQKDVEVTLVDLPEQLGLAKEALSQKNFSDRIAYHPSDMLDENSDIPKGADVYWMSQFLDCFSPEQIVSILKRVRTAKAKNSRVMIVEIFIDRQRFESAEYSLNATSLYFTCVANGNSRFYSSKQFLKLVEQAGLKVETIHDDIGLGHTLLECY